MLSFGIEASLAFCIASASEGLASGSPPPSLAATVIARASFVNSLPRRASTIAFLCLIPAHLECPAMGSILGAAPAPPRHGAATTDGCRVLSAHELARAHQPLAVQDEPAARPQGLDAVDDPLAQRHRARLVEVLGLAGDLVEAEAEVGGLHQQLGV